MSSRKAMLAILCVLVAAGAVYPFWNRSSDGRLRVIALDVGQGDSMLIRTPHGQDILVDGGPDSTIVEKLRTYLPASDRTIELAFLSHPDPDHVTGMPDVAERYVIQRVVETEIRSNSIADQQWEQDLDRQGTKRTVARAGENFDLDGVHFDILWPQTDADLATRERNDTSVVVRMTYGATSFLLVGDISTTVESRLLQSNSIEHSDVLKVPHHGSITSGDPDFINAVHPDISLISVGKGNSYGHPHPAVVRRYEQAGSRVLRTDLAGDIEIRSNGLQVSVRP